MGALAAGAHGGEIRSGELAGIVAGTAIVLWIAHVYAHSLAETISRGRRLDRAEVLSVARRELAMLLAAVAPVGALLLGAFGILQDSTAGWLAMGFGLATSTSLSRTSGSRRSPLPASSMRRSSAWASLPRR